MSRRKLISFLIYIAAIVFLSQPPCSLADSQQYVNPEYLFSIVFDDLRVSFIDIAEPPLPNHGISIHLTSGGRIYAIGEGGSNLDFYLDLVENCKKISFKSYFNNVYKCKDEIIAFKFRQLDNRSILYVVAYHETITDYGKKLFYDILSSFRVLPPDPSIYERPFSAPATGQDE
jgi:hypothetical protein